MTKCFYTLLLPLDVHPLTIHPFRVAFLSLLLLFFFVFFSSSLSIDPKQLVKLTDRPRENKMQFSPVRPVLMAATGGRARHHHHIDPARSNRCCRHRLFLFPFGRPEEHGLLPLHHHLIPSIRFPTSIIIKLK